MKTIHPDSYRDLNYTLFLERESQAWFYLFQYQWVNYRPNQGYASLEQALEAAHNHIEGILGSTNNI